MGSEDPAGGERAATDALVRQANSHPESGVDWREVGSVSARFLCVMHVFRWASEPGTRKEGAGLGGRYAGSVASLHGWSDGDPFYVNFVGHPMQGAVAGRIFLLNDRQFRSAEFGRSAPYWKGKLRSAAFAWAFSTQFEIGPLSEASIGHVQRDFPKQGFVDHVVTPAAGLAWMLAEDALDRYAITWVEDRTPNRWVRIAARTGMNPTRSFANLVSGRAPWHRDSRAGVLQYERRIPPPAISQPRSFARDIPAPSSSPLFPRRVYSAEIHALEAARKRHGAPRQPGRWRSRWTAVRCLA